MKLAFISPDGVMHCLLCHQQEKPPKDRSVTINGKRQKEELPREDKVKYGEQAAIVHLRDKHARVILERQEHIVKDEGTKVEFHGRADIECWGPLRRF